MLERKGNLIPDFVRAKMQRGERGAAYGYEEVTIVFCDISNFDELMAKLTPKEIISFFIFSNSTFIPV